MRDIVVRAHGPYLEKHMQLYRRGAPDIPTLWDGVPCNGFSLINCRQWKPLRAMRAAKAALYRARKKKGLPRLRRSHAAVVAAQAAADAAAVAAGDLPQWHFDEDVPGVPAILVYLRAANVRRALMVLMHSEHLSSCDAAAMARSALGVMEIVVSFNHSFLSIPKSATIFIFASMKAAFLLFTAPGGRRRHAALARAAL